MKKETIAEKIAKKLKDLKTGDSVSKIDIIKEIYKDHNYFIERSFDVIFAKYKKTVPHRKYKSINHTIYLIENNLKTE